MSGWAATWYSLKYLVSHLLESEHRFNSGPSITHSDLVRGSNNKFQSVLQLDKPGSLYHGYQLIIVDSD